jgi:hypothetical protein
MEAIREIGNRIDGRHIIIEGNEENPVNVVHKVERVIIDKIIEADAIEERRLINGNDGDAH